MLGSSTGANRGCGLMSNRGGSGQGVPGQKEQSATLQGTSTSDQRDFDHTYILVSSLVKAKGLVERAGFRPTPDGIHGSGLGTANTTVMMPDRRTYFELLTVVEPTPRNADKVRALGERGNHLQGVAFNWPAAKAHEAFAAAAIANGEPIDFARRVDLPDGPREARFSVALTSPDALPGVWIFAITHHTRDVVWRPDYLDHPNGALAISALVGSCPDVSEISGSWLELFPQQTTANRDGLYVRTGTATLAFLTRHAYRARFGRDPAAKGVALDIIEVEVGDIAVTRGHLHQAGIGYALTPTHGILTDTDATLGVSFHFRDASSATGLGDDAMISRDGNAE